MPITIRSSLTCRRAWSKNRFPNARRAFLLMRVGLHLLPTVAPIVATSVIAHAEVLPNPTSNRTSAAQVFENAAVDANRSPSLFGFVYASTTSNHPHLPSGNLYWFGFFHQGLKYVGNLRLDATDRDRCSVPDTLVCAASRAKTGANHPG